MTQPPASQPKRLSPRAIVAGTVAAAILVAAAVLGVKHLRFALAHEETDDAQVEGDISPVLPRISGYVASVLVRDNQHVRAGEPLVSIDSNELDLRVGEAQAALGSAQAARVTAEAVLESARAAQSVAAANTATSDVTRRKTAADLARDTALFQNGAITDSQLADTRAAADVAGARFQAAARQAEAAATQVSEAQTRIGGARAIEAQRLADLAYARLQRSYATVTAPIAGVVSRKNIEPGQFVQAGQTLLSIASEANPWVVANFKETQVGSMKAGQTAEFTVDSYPGAVFHGRVDSLSGATGARFALLPPDNASGNFVKVTQRVPVKVVITDAADPDRPLRPGVSVDVAVRTAP